MSTRTFGSVVGNTNFRDFLMSSISSIPASASSGRVSSRIRPFDKAMVMESVIRPSGFPFVSVSLASGEYLHPAVAVFLRCTHNRDQYGKYDQQSYRPPLQDQQ